MSSYKSGQFAILTVLTAASLLSTSLSSPIQKKTLDGFWLSDGYGYLFKIEGVKLDAYELTTVSCILKFSATHKSSSGGDTGIVFSNKELGNLRVVDTESA